MGAEVAIGLSIGGALLGAAASASQASEQNRAIRRSGQSAIRSANVQYGQVREQGDVELLKRRAQAEQVIGKVRVAGAESGSVDGSFAALERQEAYNADLDRTIIKRNVKSNLERVHSGLDATLTDLGARTVNPILSAFTGGIGGLQTGLSIGTAVYGLGKLLKEESEARKLAAGRR